MLLLRVHSGKDNGDWVQLLNDKSQTKSVKSKIGGLGMGIVHNGWSISKRENCKKIVINLYRKLN